MENELRDDYGWPYPVERYDPHEQCSNTIRDLQADREYYRALSRALEEDVRDLEKELKTLRELRDTVVASSLDGTILRAVLTGFELGREA